MGESASGRWRMRPVVERARVPALAASTAAMFGGAVMLLGVGLLTWQPGRNPFWVLAAMLGVALGFCLVSVVAGHRLTRTHAAVMTAIQLGALAALTSTTGLDLAALANGSVLPIIGAYATWFLHPVWGRAMFYAGVLAWMGAVALRDDPGLATFAASIVVQSVVAAEAFALIKRRLDRIARTDALTGVLNRWGIGEAADRALARAVRRGADLAIAVVDLDDLREINNTRGHQAGDDMLVAVAQDWTARLRSHDVVGRLGGDEFVIILPGSNQEAAETVLRRLAEDSPASWSAGVAVAKPRDDLERMLARADARMYVSKSARRLRRPDEQRGDDNPFAVTA